MAKKIILLTIFFLFLSNVYAFEYDANSKYIYVYNDTLNKTIYEKNSNQKIQVASLTKIMTAIIVIENNGDLNKQVIINDNDLRDMYVYVTAGLKTNYYVTLQDLLYGILLKSGSEAVNAAVRVTTNSEDEFVNLMNAKVKELGLKNTHFSNPIGKDENNYSTAFDMAMIMKYCLKNETFKSIISSREYNVLNLNFKGPLNNLNNYISGAKTGYTTEAMYSLISYSDISEFRYIVVTTYADSYSSMFNDNNNIYEYIINNYGYIDYEINYDIPIKNGKNDFYNISIKTKLYLEKSYNPELLIYKYDGIDEITKKVNKNDKLGIISIYYNSEKIDEIIIYLDEKIEYKNYLKYGVFVLIIIVILKFIFRSKKR